MWREQAAKKHELRGELLIVRGVKEVKVWRKIHKWKDNYEYRTNKLYFLVSHWALGLSVVLHPYLAHTSPSQWLSPLSAKCYAHSSLFPRLGPILSKFSHASLYQVFRYFLIFFLITKTLFQFLGNLFWFIFLHKTDQHHTNNVIYFLSLCHYRYKLLKK